MQVEGGARIPAMMLVARSRQGRDGGGSTHRHEKAKVTGFAGRVDVGCEGERSQACLPVPGLNPWGHADATLR